MAEKCDWDAVEIEYIKGVRSNRNIGEQFGVSEAAIRKKAKQLGWAKDLSAKIRAAAEEKVRKAAFESSAQGKQCERDLVDNEANLLAALTVSHRKDLRKARSITSSHFEELELCVDMPLKEKATIGKMLTESLKTQVTLEREVFGIVDTPDFAGNQTVTKIELVALR